MARADTNKEKILLFTYHCSIGLVLQGTQSPFLPWQQRSVARVHSQAVSDGTMSGWSAPPSSGSGSGVSKFPTGRLGDGTGRAIAGRVGSTTGSGSR